MKMQVTRKQATSHSLNSNYSSILEILGGKETRKKEFIQVT